VISSHCFVGASTLIVDGIALAKNSFLAHQCGAVFSGKSNASARLFHCLLRLLERVLGRHQKTFIRVMFERLSVRNARTMRRPVG
jgi:hypothetical protein